MVTVVGSVRRRVPHQLPILLAAAAALPGPGCAGKDSATATIGPDGGSIEVGDVTVEIPAGAIAEDTEIGVEIVDDVAERGWPALPEGIGQQSGTALILTPHGLQFDQVVTVTMPTELSGTELVLFRLDDEESSVWVPDGAIRLQDGMLSFDVTHFSVYSPATVAAGQCPCWSGADLAAWKAATEAAVDSVSVWRSLSFGPIAARRWDVGSWLSVSRLTTYTNPAANPPYYHCVRSSTIQPRPFTELNEEISDAEHAFCELLLTAAGQHATFLRSVAAWADGLPAGEWLDVHLELTAPNEPTQTASVVLDTDQELSWIWELYPDGTTWSASIASVTPGATCTIANPSGTLAGANVAIEVDCVAATPPCEIDLSGEMDLGSGLQAATLHVDARCSFLKIVPAAGDPWFESLVIHDVDIDPATVDIEAIAFWDTFISGGGTLFGVVPFEDDHPAVENHVGAATRDITFAVSEDLGALLSFEPGLCSYELRDVDTVAMQFAMDVDLVAELGAPYPPADANGDGAIDMDPATATLSGTISGVYEIMEFHP